MEVLGTYDPTPRVPLASDAPEVIDEVTGLPRKPKKYKDIQLDQSRTKYWLGVGAQPTEPVERLLCLVGCSYALEPEQKYDVRHVLTETGSQIGLMEPRPGKTKKTVPSPTMSEGSVPKTVEVS